MTCHDCARDAWTGCARRVAGELAALACAATVLQKAMSKKQLVKAIHDNAINVIILFMWFSPE